MDTEVLDLTNVDWSNTRSYTTNGMLPKTVIGTTHIKMSSYNPSQGVYGNDAIMEVIAGRIGRQLGINCLAYRIADALVEKDGKRFRTYVCISDDFRQGRETVDFEAFYLRYRKEEESAVEFAYRLGAANDIHEMFVYDFIIGNLDRHGRNIEIFTDCKKIAPLFDNGFSLLSKIPDQSIKTAEFDDNTTVNNFIGHTNLLMNLKEYVADKCPVKLNNVSRNGLFDGIPDIISKERRDKIYEHVSKRCDYARKIKAVL
jgi:hypothetical protein